MKTVNHYSFAGIFAALASSLCCISPVLATLAGTSSLATTFSWLEPARPFLIGLTGMVLGFAWYKKLPFTTSSQTSCDCEQTSQGSFFQSTRFLAIVTGLSLVLMTFPLYSHVFFNHQALNSKSEAIIQQKQTVLFKISGMTCAGCAHHVKSEIEKLKGILRVEVSYEKGEALVEFDSALVSIRDIEKSINSTGYKVISHKEI